MSLVNNDCIHNCEKCNADVKQNCLKYENKTSITKLLGVIFEGYLVMIDNTCKVIHKGKDEGKYEVCTKPKEDYSETPVSELPVERVIDSIEEFNDSLKNKPVYIIPKKNKILYIYCEYEDVLGRKVHFTDPNSLCSTRVNNY